MRLSRIHIAIAVAILALIVAPLVLSSFTMSLLNYIGVYALVAIGLALLTGVGGIVPSDRRPSSASALMRPPG